MKDKDETTALGASSNKSPPKANDAEQKLSERLKVYEKMIELRKLNLDSFKKIDMSKSIYIYKIIY